MNNSNNSGITNTTAVANCSHNINKKTFEVKFSAFEFLAASARLSPLNVEGMESFVGNMLERAISSRQNVPESVRQHNLFPKLQKKKDEKNSNFCTIRQQHPPQQQQQQQQQQQLQQQKNESNSITLNNNNVSNGDVVIFGRNSPAQLSCSKCRDESNCQLTSSRNQNY